MRIENYARINIRIARNGIKTVTGIKLFKKTKKLLTKLLTKRKYSAIIMDVVEYVPLAQLDRATAF